MIFDNEQYFTMLRRGLAIELNVLNGAELKEFFRKWGGRKDRIATIREETAVYKLIDNSIVLVREYAGGEINIDNFKASKAVDPGNMSAKDALKALDGL